MTEPIRVEDVLCKLETERALLVVVEDEEVWIPKSVIHDDSEVYGKGHEGVLVVEPWFAAKHGWE